MAPGRARWQVLAVMLAIMVAIAGCDSGYDYYYSEGSGDLGDGTLVDDGDTVDSVRSLGGVETETPTETEDAVLTKLSVREEIITERINRTLDARPMVTQVVKVDDSEVVNSILLQSSDLMDYSVMFLENKSYLHKHFEKFYARSGLAVSMAFRTDKPHGLLTRVKLGEKEEIQVFLHNGIVALRVHSGTTRETFKTGAEGMQDEEWHTLAVSGNADSNVLTITVDATDYPFTVAKFPEQTKPGLLKLWFGGDNRGADAVRSVSRRQFHGCMRDLVVRPLGVPEDLATVSHTACSARGVTSDMVCANPCLSDPCPSGSACSNHFSHASCDCSGTGMAGLTCDKPEEEVLSLNGDGHLEYSLYDWSEAAHTDDLSISFQFKTETADSLLFVAVTELPRDKFISIFINHAGELKFGGSFIDSNTVQMIVDGIEILEYGGYPIVTDNEWHTVKFTYTANDDTKPVWKPEVYFGNSPVFDSVCNQPFSQGNAICDDATSEEDVYHYNSEKGACESRDYSGCGGNSNRFASLEECVSKCKPDADVPSRLPFLGCLRKVYVDGASVLEAVGRGGAAYTGGAGSCQEKKQPTISLTSARSSALIPTTETSSEGLELAFEFKLTSFFDDGIGGELAMGSVEMEGELHTWLLYVYDGSFHFKLDNDKYNLKSDTELLDSWNTVTLTMTMAGDSTTVVLTLNDKTSTLVISPRLSFISGVTLGADRAVLRSCVGNLVLNGALVDLRRHLDSPNGVVMDACQGVGPCQSPTEGCLHGSVCAVTSQGRSSCDCPPGLEGNRCHLQRFARSCKHYRRHGFSQTGVYMIDVDGTGPLPPVPVTCRFTDKSSIMELASNIPPETVVRTQDMETYTLSVDYKKLSYEQLQQIVDSADSCHQDLTFNCRKSPLRLSSLTWFSSPKETMFSHFGSTPDATCPCSMGEQCLKPELNCNCDADDNLWRTDVGTITENRLLPVTGVSFVMVDGQMNGYTNTTLTVGNLVCETKNEPEEAVSLLNSKSFLELHHSSYEGQELSTVGLAFRTSASQATILHKPAHTSDQADFRIVLTSETSLEFVYQHQRHNETLTFHTAYQLNTAAWQHVWLDTSSSEIRVLLNGHKKFLNIQRTKPTLEGDIYLGGTPSDMLASVYGTPSTPGLIGCLKNFQVNIDTVSLAMLADHSPSESYRQGCHLSCDPNPCLHDGICTELKEGQYSCECSNKWGHLGDDCQNDVNTNAITLTNSKTALSFNYYDAVPEDEANPLRSDITFAFRTRDLQALLFFAKDHVQNLVQVYMETPHKLSMIWNHLYELHTLTVDVDDLVLNNGELVQVHVERTSRHTSLHVLTQGVSLVATATVPLALLTEQQYQRFPFGSHVPHADLTLYQGSAALPETKFTMQVGGAAGELVGKIPGLVGCLSGFCLDSYCLDLDSPSVWTVYEGTYETGCFTPCASSAACGNGGKCWNVFDHAAPSVTECHCEDTSYVGDTCEEEFGFNFNGEEAIILSNDFPIFKEAYVVDLGFSMSSEASFEEGTVQTLLLHRESAFFSDFGSDSDDSVVLGLALESSQTLQVLTATTDGLYESRWFNYPQGNLSDGYRHHLSLSVSREDVSVQMDGATLAVDKQGSWPQSSVDHPQHLMTIGGLRQNETDKWALSWKTFEGCISNVQLRGQSKKAYRPLETYVTQTHKTLPNRQSCSRFRDDSAPTIVHNYEEFLQHAEHLVEAPKREGFQPYEIEETEVKEYAGIQTAGKIGAFIMLAVALGMAYYLYRITHKEPQEEESLENKQYELVKMTEESTTAPPPKPERSSVLVEKTAL